MGTTDGVRYGVDDRPPPGLSLLMGLQLAVGVGLPLVYPVVVFRSAGLPSSDIPSFLSWGLFALAAAALLQAARPRVGNGYLMPSLSSALYLQPSVAAVTIGGRALLTGMTLVAGLFEVGFSRVVTRLRHLFPPVVTGLVVFLVGAEVGLEAVRLGVDAVRDSVASDLVEGAISAATFLGIVGGVVWGSLWVRNMAPVIGVAIGTVLSVLLIEVPTQDREFIGSTGIVGIPSLPDTSIAFEWSLVIPFLVLGLAAALRTVGVVMTLHEAAHPGERATDHREVARGVRNDGIGAALSGAVGMPGTSSAPSAVGVQMSAGIMSRSVAIWLAGCLVALAFLPRALAYLVTAPAAVVSALLVYYASFMMIGGVKLVFRQRLDSRATFVLGGSISLALGARTYGMSSTTSDGTDWVGLITGSMVTVGVLTAVGLSLLFRIGQRRRRRFSLHVDGDATPAVVSAQVGRAVDELVDDRAGDGPRRTASAIVAEVISRGLADSDVEARVSTDDLRLRVELTYDGRPLDVDPRRPLDADDLTDENVFAAGLARYLDVPRPDDLRVTTRGRQVHLELTYDLV